MGENADRARQGYQAFNRVGLEAINDEFFHTDVVVAEPPELPDSTVTQGLDPARAGLVKFLELFDDVAVTADEIIERGDRTLAAIRFSGTGKGSGVAVDAARFDVATWRDGKISRMEAYLDREPAEKALDAG